VKKAVPRPLEAVCLKAMTLQPNDRYATALDLANDVERWLADEPVTAYREPWIARAERWLRRRRTLVTGVGVAALLLVLGGGAAVFWYQQQQAEHARGLGETEKGLELAAQEATTLLDRGLKEMQNPQLWQTTLAAAQTAAQQAETFLAHEPQLQEGTLGEWVRQLRARLDAEKKDCKLVHEFEGVLFKLSQFNRGYSGVEGYQDMRAALARWGLPPGGGPVERARDLIQQRPREMQHQLAAILQSCFFWIPTREKEQKEWLEAVLAAADADPWRQRVREAMSTQDLQRLEHLVSEVDVAKQPAALLTTVYRSPLLRRSKCSCTTTRPARPFSPSSSRVRMPPNSKARRRAVCGSRPSPGCATTSRTTPSN
jgi:hypothetical protein